MSFSYGDFFAEECVMNLNKKEFDAHSYNDIYSAKIAINKILQNYSTFGFPGSHTVRAFGLIEDLKNQNKIVYDHWDKSLSSREMDKVRLQQCRCDCLICSANAISVNGDIVNVDGFGNRISGSIYGNKKVLIVAGTNKITPSLEKALCRIKNTAAPMRAKEIGAKTPCAKTGICSDCNSSQRICRVTAIMHYKPIATDISVFLIKEKLGF